jgi:hypothetical protein
MKNLLIAILILSRAATADLCEDATAHHQSTQDLVDKNISTVEKCLQYQQEIEEQFTELEQRLKFWTSIRETYSDSEEYFAKFADQMIAETTQELIETTARLKRAAWMVGMAQQLLLDAAKQWIRSQAAMWAACGYWSSADPGLPVPDPEFE